MYPGIKERLNVYVNLCMHTVQLNLTFSIYSLSWMVPITLCASVRISTVFFSEFTLKTFVEISTN